MITKICFSIIGDVPMTGKLVEEIESESIDEDESGTRTSLKCIKYLSYKLMMTHMS